MNVVALTEDGKAVLVKQFRHGTRETTLEIPGGAVDPGDRSPLAAARRELREETGYVARRWTRIGLVQPNPAFQTNACTTFLAEMCRRAGEPDPDEGEELEVVLVPASGHACFLESPKPVLERILRFLAHHPLAA